MRVSGGATVVGKDLANETIVTPVKEAVKQNAIGVGVSVFVGSDYETQTVSNLANVVSEAHDYGLPVLGITAVAKELQKREARFLALASRVCVEMGADIIKTYYCEGFEKITSTCPAPVVIAGGPKLDSIEDALNITYNALQEGAIGVDMGRNIWQSEHPAAMIQAIHGIVKNGLNVKEALELYGDVKTKIIDRLLHLNIYKINIYYKEKPISNIWAFFYIFNCSESNPISTDRVRSKQSHLVHQTYCDAA